MNESPWPGSLVGAPGMPRLQGNPWPRHIPETTNKCINEGNKKSMFLSQRDKESFCTFQQIQMWPMPHRNFKDLCIFRERGSGRETSICGYLLSAPYWGITPQPRHVPDWELNQ